MGKSSGGGLFSGGSETSTSQLQTRDLRNFAPFQLPAIQSVFDSLTPDLLQVPSTAQRATDQSLAAATQLLGRLQRLDPLGNLQGVSDIVNQDIGAQPFNEAQDRFEEIFDEAERLFGAEIGRDAAERVVSLLLPTAEGQFLPGQVQANRFFEPFVVQPTLDDARNQIATLFAQSGRLTSPSAAQTVARETGRIAGGLRSDQFNRERQLQQGAQTAIGQFDANEAIRRLNAVTGQTNARLAATQGIQNSIAAAEQRRANLLGTRAGIAGQQFGAQLGLLPQIPQLAIQQTQLPFVPLSNFSNIAFQPLGQTGTISTVGTSETESSPSLFNTLAGGALTAAGLGFDPFSKGGTLNAGFGPFGPNLGPLSAGAGAAPPVPRFF